MALNMEDKDVLVKVEGLSKKFCKDLKTSLWYGVKDLFAGVTGRHNNGALRPKEFWAVKNINFELRRGECLGLIGHNGAGKSTLLKILNGLINPDEGKVTIVGKVGALIELGAGFNLILSGRENIYNNGAVLGFTRAEIDAKLEAIIDFAELREFIDMPVRNYSSGMKVRLGFAVAAQMEPDVLIIDEVLAVGDVSFRAKCYERINELLEKSAIIFVSHSMPQISKICTSAIFMNRGVMGLKGSSGMVIESYFNSINDKIEKYNLISKFCELKSFKISNKHIKNYNENIIFYLEVSSINKIKNVDISIVLMSRDLIPVSQASSKLLKNTIDLDAGINEIQFVSKDLNLNTGKYTFSLTIEGAKNGQVYLWVQNIDIIDVRGDYVGVSPVLINGEWKKIN